MRKLKKKIFAIYSIITLIFFGILIKMEFATDTYSVFNFNKQEVYVQFAISGRFVTAIVFWLVKTIKISEKMTYTLSWFLAIICAILSQYKLYTIIEKDVKKKALKLINPALIIINPFSIELFLFIEKGIMWFGILMCILALENLIKYFENKKIKHIIYAITLMFIANCSYQGIIGIFVAISLVYIIKYSKDIKQFIVNNILVGAVYGIPTIMNYFIVKTIYKSSRVNGEIILQETLKKIIFHTKDMAVNMYNILPRYTFILLIVFTFGVFCCKIWKEKKNKIQILKYLYLIIGITVISILPQIVQPTNSIWFVPRTTYCFSSMYGILVLYLSINYNLKNIARYAIIAISIILIIFQLQRFIQIEKDRFALNKKDEETTINIIKEINKYEQRTGNRIEEISIYYDMKPNFTYEKIFATGDINVKCYANDWSTVAILNYYLKRNLKLKQSDENIEQQYLKQNWDKFDKKQINFEGKIIIICNY